MIEREIFRDAVFEACCDLWPVGAVCNRRVTAKRVNDALLRARSECREPFHQLGRFLWVIAWEDAQVVT